MIKFVEVVGDLPISIRLAGKYNTITLNPTCKSIPTKYIMIAAGSFKEEKSINFFSVTNSFLCFKRYPLTPVHKKYKTARILKDHFIFKVETDLVTIGTNIKAPELPPEATTPIANPLYLSNHKAGADRDMFTIKDEPRPYIIP
ncbi:hypothetical protein AYI68_g5249 [Smittium mucronatum]|uniref:Uncharacterized protein n=1 Tax=Smittium mucronatum TaxID=133383 RepID=A0A1R0GUS7_9FUNG|nr:hypothetical protein AYI68_g5249 [Smittium mucronatum]